MRPLFGVVAGIAAAAHFAFLAYLGLGGFAAVALHRAHRRGWRCALAAHLAVVAWAVGSVVLNLCCPLTVVERWARERAGMAPLGPAGFIDHYLTGVLYPSNAGVFVQVAVFAVIAVSWVLLATDLRAGRSTTARRQ